MIRTFRLVVFSCNRPTWAVLLACFIANGIAAAMGYSAEPARRSFNLPAGEAEATLRLFAAQAGGQFVYAAEKVAGVRTNLVKGNFTKHEALERMLQGTGLRAVIDAKTGALTVDRIEESADEPKARPKANNRTARRSGA